MKFKLIVTRKPRKRNKINIFKTILRLVGFKDIPPNITDTNNMTSSIKFKIDNEK